jgi:hypothetical protein
LLNRASPCSAKVPFLFANLSETLDYRERGPALEIAGEGAHPFKEEKSMKKALTFVLAAGVLAFVACIPVKSAQAGVGIYIGPGWGGYYGWPYRYRYYGYPYAYYPYWRRPYPYYRAYWWRHHYHRRYWR